MTLADIQRRVGVTPDGIWGPNTAAAVAKALDGQPDASSELVALATKHLNREEGRIPHAYQDSLGYRSEEHTSELQSLMRISYAVFCLKTKTLPIITTAT